MSLTSFVPTRVPSDAQSSMPVTKSPAEKNVSPAKFTPGGPFKVIPLRNLVPAPVPSDFQSPE